MEIQYNEYLNILIKTFVSDFSKIRCCGSCIGGCQDERICFICCGYSAKDLKELLETNKEFKEAVDKKVKQAEKELFERFMKNS